MNIKNLPFTFETNVDFEQPTISGTLRLALEPAVTRPDLEPSIEVLDIFMDAVSMNFFFASQDTPSCRRCKTKPEDMFNFEYEVQTFPVQSLWVLLGLWAQTAWSGDEIKSLKIFLTPAPEQCHPPNCDPKRIFARPSGNAFTIHIPKDFADFLPLDMLIRFTDEVDPNTVDRIAHLLEVWGFLDSMGGFDFGFCEQNDFSPDFGEVAHLEPAVVSYYKSGINGGLAALNLLFNGLSNFSNQGPAIVSLHLDAPS